MFPLFCQTVEEDAELALPGSWLNEVLQFLFGLENQSVPVTPTEPSWVLIASPISEEMWDFPTVSVTLLVAEVTRGRKRFVWVLV